MFSFKFFTKGAVNQLLATQAVEAEVKIAKIEAEATKKVAGGVVASAIVTGGIVGIIGRMHGNKIAKQAANINTSLKDDIKLLKNGIMEVNNSASINTSVLPTDGEYRKALAAIQQRVAERENNGN